MNPTKIKINDIVTYKSCSGFFDIFDLHFSYFIKSNEALVELVSHYQ